MVDDGDSGHEGDQSNFEETPEESERRLEVIGQLLNMAKELQEQEEIRKIDNTWDINLRDINVRRIKELIERLGYARDKDARFIQRPTREGEPWCIISTYKGIRIVLTYSSGNDDNHYSGVGGVDGIMSRIPQEEAEAQIYRLFPALRAIDWYMQKERKAMTIEDIKAFGDRKIIPGESES